MELKFEYDSDFDVYAVQEVLDENDNRIPELMGWIGLAPEIEVPFLNLTEDFSGIIELPEIEEIYKFMKKLGENDE